MQQAVERRLTTLEHMRAIWQQDLERNTLGAVFVSARQDLESLKPAPAVPAQPADLNEDSSDGDEQDDTACDSDDASDAYSTVADEDEPIADLLDDIPLDAQESEDADRDSKTVRASDSVGDEPVVALSVAVRSVVDIYAALELTRHGRRFRRRSR